MSLSEEQWQELVTISTTLEEILRTVREINGGLREGSLSFKEKNSESKSPSVSIQSVDDLALRLYNLLKDRGIGW